MPDIDPGDVVQNRLVDVRQIVPASDEMERDIVERLTAGATDYDLVGDCVAVLVV